MSNRIVPSITPQPLRNNLLQEAVKHYEEFDKWDKKISGLTHEEQYACKSIGLIIKDRSDIQECINKYGLEKLVDKMLELAPESKGIYSVQIGDAMKALNEEKERKEDFIQE